ncbi:MAG: ABC transporter permease [Eubacteriales bacterium]|nr:ABC transporter permease [Eubacteriales bacterium]
MNFWILVRRNMKMYFSDKMAFFTSLISPLVLLVLYLTFLGKMTTDSLLSYFPEGTISTKLANSLTGGELVSSLLAVSGVTISFTSNMRMIRDELSGAMDDFLLTPVRKPTLFLSYFVASFLASFLLCLATAFFGILYLFFQGGYLDAKMMFLLLLEIALLSLFGTSLSSFVNVFVKSESALSAISALVSSAYGFLIGSYVPIHSFSEGLQNVLLFLPSTHMTSLLRKTMLSLPLEEVKEEFGEEVAKTTAESLDASFSFNGKEISTWVMVLMVLLTCLVLLLLYLLFTYLKASHSFKIKKEGKPE